MLSFIDDPGGAQSGLWLIVLLPLVGALVNGLAGRQLGRGNVSLVACAAVIGAFLASLIPFVWTARGVSLHSPGPTWFQVGDYLSLRWGLLFDRLSGTLTLVITGVGSLIHLYSIGYMSHEDEAGYARYFTYLNLFVAAMLILVLGDSLVLTFVGWEGVGLCSYLLIGYWYTDPPKAFAGRKAFVVNRIGDLGFLLGIFGLLALFGTSDYGQLARLVQGAPAALDIQAGPFAGFTLGAALTVVCLCLVLACTGKSAQIPLYVWLPDAMAGPTPVSALIHAATMVTAGVYLVARTAFLFALAPGASGVVVALGALTALMAALIALVQTDIKKVLAYSTVSQLGFMFIGVGAGAYAAAVLHLVTHAFFKACLFLGAGSVMHGMGDETDIRKMGGLSSAMPHTGLTFAISTLAITGIAPLSGFFSKDAILHGAWVSHNDIFPWMGRAAYGVGMAAAFCTAFYMVRLYALTFSGRPRSEAAEHAHESPAIMTGPLWALAGLSVAATLLGLPGEGALGEVMGRFLAPVFATAGSADHGEGSLVPFFLFAWLVAVSGGGLAMGMYVGGWVGTPARLAAAAPGLYRLLWDRFRVDEIYDTLVVVPLRSLAYLLWKVVDAFAIDGILVSGTARVVASTAALLRQIQNGDAQRYVAMMVLAAAAIAGTVLGMPLLTALGGGR
jgi:NADH-quinone oxidoreductase subunit L